MPQRTERSGKSLFHVLFLAAALSLLSAVVRRERRQLIMATKARKKKVRVAPRRLAASLAFAMLFFAGAALSAGAGNTVTRLFDQTSDSTLSAESTSTDTTTTEDPAAAAAEGAPADAAAPDAADPGPSDSEAAVAPASADPTQAPEARVSNTKGAGVQAALSQRAKVGLATKPDSKESAAGKVKEKARRPEAEIWIPTPKSR